MATQSFTKAVTLRGQKEAKAFVKAVERSEQNESKNVSKYERLKVKEMDIETIQTIFHESAEAAK